MTSPSLSSAESASPKPEPEYVKVEKADRRILRTRRMLSEAILALIVEKPYEAITVSDITARADVNRATFYHHFQTIDELLNYALKAQFDELVDRFDTLPSGEGVMFDYEANVLVFRYVGENARLFRVLLGEQGLGQVIFRMTHYIAEVYERLLPLKCEIRQPGDTGYVPVAVMAQHMAGSMLGLMRWWLINNMPITAEEMARMEHQLDMFGVQSAVIWEELNPDGYKVLGGKSE